MDSEYSYASTSWLPIKSYYLFFNQLLTIEYLIKVAASAFQATHSGCVQEFTRKLSVGDITFSVPELNQVFDQTIFSFTLPTGANLSRYTPRASMFRLAMKKIARYKLEEWQRKCRHKARTLARRMAQEAFLRTFTVSIFEFPYYMRLRANYRDFAFIDAVDHTETAQYFQRYYDFASSLDGALSALRADLENVRT